MAKYSISKMLEGKRKMRIVTILACLLTIALISNLIVSKNPKKGHATEKIYTEDTTLPADTDIPDTDVIVDGATLTVSGQNHFKSLIIRNHGSITHLQITTGLGDNADINDPSEALKRVDLVINESLKMESGGIISVSGKGFQPNGDFRCDGCAASKNEGPGGGWNAWRYKNDNIEGGGAGYGGRGGPGDPVGNVPDSGRGAVYNSNPPMRVGSAGGNADGYGKANSYGGAGGGRIHIVASSIDIDPSSGIYANGSSGEKKGDFTAGGGGSGGSIWIQLTGNVISGVLAESLGSAAYGGEDNAVVTIGVTSDSPTINTHANGGNSRFSGYGGGGAGRVLIEAIYPERISVKKEYKPISRAGVNCGTSTAPIANCFNAYALQLDDVIEVDLTVTPLDNTGPVEIADEMLHGATGAGDPWCGYVPNSYILRLGVVSGSDSVSYGNRTLIWKFTFSSHSSASMSYQCRVGY